MTDTLRRATQIAEQACGHWPCITSAPQLFMHRENSVFQVQTTRGPAALRIHRHGYHSKAAIQSEMQWMAHLSANGLQVPEPLINGEGVYLAEIPFEGKIHVADLLTWLDGAPLGNSIDPLGHGKGELENIFFNLGVVIARLHAVSDAWNMPAGFKRHAWDRDGYVGEAPLWGAFWKADGLSGVERNILRAAREKAGLELDALRKAGADYGLIHADFVRQNILVTGADVCIIDFDDCGFGFRMYDFATALVKNRAEPHYKAIRQSLFEGYRSLRHLSMLDEQSLDLFLALRDFAYLGWMEARRGEPGVEVRMADIRSATIAAAEAFLIAAAPAAEL
jgi:Ser/Thr protein kinase RdoA (MazF antagonist)